MQQVKVKLTGTSPLIMHNNRMVNPLDEIRRKIKEITSKRKKTDDDHIALMELEFQGGLYYDEELGPIIPQQNVKAMLCEAARKSKQGKDVKQSVTVIENKIKLEYKGPRDIKGMWQAAMYDVRGVSVGQSTVMRTRPIFHDWSCTFTIAYDEAVVNKDDVLMWLTVAGKQTGFMDNRPDFGRFDFKEV